MKEGLHSGYLEACFSVNETKDVIKKLRKSLRKIEFDGFLVQGLSGIIMGTLVSRAMNKKLVVARKGEKTHGMLVENILEGDKLIIIDDFCSSGSTIKKIFKTVKQFECWIYGEKAARYGNPKVDILGAVYYSRSCVFVPGSTPRKLIDNTSNIEECWNNVLSIFEYRY